MKNNDNKQHHQKLTKMFNNKIKLILIKISNYGLYVSDMFGMDGWDKEGLDGILRGGFCLWECWWGINILYLGIWEIYVRREVLWVVLANKYVVRA